MVKIKTICYAYSKQIDGICNLLFLTSEVDRLFKDNKGTKIKLNVIVLLIIVIMTNTSLNTN